MLKIYANLETGQNQNYVQHHPGSYGFSPVPSKLFDAYSKRDVTLISFIDIGTYVSPTNKGDLDYIAKLDTLYALINPAKVLMMAVLYRTGGFNPPDEATDCDNALKNAGYEDYSGIPYIILRNNIPWNGSTAAEIYAGGWDTVAEITKPYTFIIKKDSSSNYMVADKWHMESSDNGNAGLGAGVAVDLKDLVHFQTTSGVNWTSTDHKDNFITFANKRIANHVDASANALTVDVVNNSFISNSTKINASFPRKSRSIWDKTKFLIRNTGGTNFVNSIDYVQSTGLGYYIADDVINDRKEQCILNVAALVDAETLSVVNNGITDTDGTAADFGTISYTVDLEPPIIASFTRTSPSPTSSAEVSYSFSVSDNRAVGAYQLSESSSEPATWIDITPVTPFNHSGTYTVSTGNGTKTIYLWARDAAGNVCSTPGHITVEIDKTLPVVTGFTRTSAATTNDPVVAFTVKGTDNDGINAWRVTTSDTKPSPTPESDWTPVAPTTNLNTTGAFTISGESGDYNLYLWVRDRAGNVSDVYTSQPVKFLLAKPVVTVFNRTSQAASTSPTVTYSMEAWAKNSITHWMVRTTAGKPAVGDAGWVAYTAGTGVSSNGLLLEGQAFTITDGDPSSVTLYAWVKDSAGKVSDLTGISSFQVDYNTKLPQVSVFNALSPVPISIGNPQFQINGTASSGSTLSQYLITESSERPDASASWIACPALPASVSHPLTGDGLIEFYLWFKDSTGRISNINASSHKTYIATFNFSSWGDLLVRDNNNDAGFVPSVGDRTKSPDINTSGTTRMADHVNYYRAHYSSEPLSFMSLVGDKVNFIYITAKNLGGTTITGEVRLFWFNGSITNYLDEWKSNKIPVDGSPSNFVNKLTIPSGYDIPHNEIAVTEKPFVWNPDPVYKIQKHFCVIAIASSSQRPWHDAFIPAHFPSRDCYELWIQFNPNLAYKNTDVNSNPSNTKWTREDTVFIKYDGSLYNMFITVECYNVPKNTTIKLSNTGGVLFSGDQNGTVNSSTHYLMLTSQFISPDADYSGSVTTTATLPAGVSSWPVNSSITVSMYRISTSPLLKLAGVSWKFPKETPEFQRPVKGPVKVQAKSPVIKKSQDDELREFIKANQASFSEQVGSKLLTMANNKTITLDKEGEPVIMGSFTTLMNPGNVKETGDVKVPGKKVSVPVDKTMMVKSSPAPDKKEAKAKTPLASGGGKVKPEVKAKPKMAVKAKAKPAVKAKAKPAVKAKAKPAVKAKVKPAVKKTVTKKVTVKKPAVKGKKK